MSGGGHDSPMLPPPRRPTMPLPPLPPSAPRQRVSSMLHVIPNTLAKMTYAEEPCVGHGEAQNQGRSTPALPLPAQPWKLLAVAAACCLEEVPEAR